MSELIAALLGAAAAGAVQIIIELRRRQQKREAILRAVAGEVGTLCQFVRLQDYAGDYARAAQEAAAGREAHMMPINAQRNYFTMYEAVASDIGELSAPQAAAISRFYTLCKIAMDTANPNSLFPPTAQNLRFMSGLTMLILKEGDAIVQFPKQLVTFEPLG